MAEAFLVDAVRTPVGRRGGGLAGVHPADLGAHVIAALLARTGADPLAVDDVRTAGQPARRVPDAVPVGGRHHGVRLGVRLEDPVGPLIG